MLRERLERNRNTILELWLERALSGRANDDSLSMVREPDRFRNPVEHAFRECLPGLLDALLSYQDIRENAARLEPIIRIRAVQDFRIEQAPSFLLMLSDIVRQQAEGIPCSETDKNALAELEGRISEMADLARDLFADCREQIRLIRARDSQRRSYVQEKAAANRR